ncbi:SDR family oxidoreductase [Maribacter hydrothermalis]|uniref:Short-chain dehydrogenase/reductase n=1 Tax=Maribacter hydrothermalis TaxID=1836467 RepID=A0A1B7Z846_9FLAO|nr:SDR family oxidoreductase [Maribacter hydrothermalis]APQ19133.1 short-chain dehydrogenase/reductase [Maribacter hydrothermalis]OBR38856.1 short-chain dehydrogenase/reductase [Maribacter hydrothermalis]
MKTKVVLITGGSSGIGKAIGLHLKEKGYIVYGTTRNLSKYSSFVDFPLLEMDVQNIETIKTCIAALIKKESRIDVLVNNAGVGITGPMEETPQSEVVNAFATNFNGPLRVINEVLPIMRAQKMGLVINITSIAGYMGLPFRGIYSASKAALEMVTESYRFETKCFGVKFTTVAPGDFATNIAAGRYHAPVYEKSPYKKDYSSTLEAIDADVDSGGDPIEVGKIIAKIIETKNPKPHYRVGSFIQKLSLTLKNLLPGLWFEKLLENHNSH